MSRLIPILSLLAAAPALAAPMGGPESFVLLEKEALLVSPPRLVTTGMVGQVEWSPDGRHVLAGAADLPYPLRLDFNRPPRLRSKLVLWNAASGESKELWAGTDATGPTEPRFAWFSRGEAAAVLLTLERPVPPAERAKAGVATRPERWLFRLDARRGLLKPVIRVGDHAQVIAAPNAPAAMVWSWEDSTRLLVRPEGPAQPVQVANAVLQNPQWLADGRRALLGWALMNKGEKTERGRPLVIDTGTGAVQQVDAAQVLPWQAPERSGPLRLVRGQVAVRDGERTARLTPIWLESVVRTEQPRVLLAPSAENAELSPAGDAALYVDDRGAWVTRPTAIPREAFFAARQAAERARILSNGKQLGTALMMYAQDYDERLPGADQPVNSLLQPYLKNDALFEGFVYTFGGGPISSIEKPAEQVLGHVLGPGGRAMIYADGHVTWEPGAPR